MTSAEELMPTEAIEMALAAVRRDLAEQEIQRAELVRKIAAAKEEEHLLERILALRRGGRLSPSEVDNDTDRTHSSGETNLPDAVAEELRSAGRPLHISDLMRLMKMRDVKIPGAGTQANLITYLRRDTRFIRPARGLYALSEWGLDAMPPTRRRKRRRRATHRATEKEQQ